MKKSTKHLLFYVFLAFSVIGPMITLGQDRGFPSQKIPIMASVWVSLAPIWFCAILTALFVLVIGGVQEKYLNTSAFLYAIPGFVIMQLLSYPKIAFSYGFLSIEKVMLNNPVFSIKTNEVDFDKVSFLKPTNGYITHFMLYFFAVIIVFAFIRLFVVKNFKEFFAFRKENLLCLVFPLFFGYLDSFISKIYALYIGPLNLGFLKMENFIHHRNIKLTFDRKHFQIQKLLLPAQLYTILTLIALCFVFMLILKKVHFSKQAKIVLISVIALYLLKSYLVYMPPIKNFALYESSNYYQRTWMPFHYFVQYTLTKGLFTTALMLSPLLVLVFQKKKAE